MVGSTLSWRRPAETNRDTRQIVERQSRYGSQQRRSAGTRVVVDDAEEPNAENKWLESASHRIIVSVHLVGLCMGPQQTYTHTGLGPNKIRSSST